MKLDLIRPVIFSPFESVQCIFTKANRHISSQRSDKIEGLHLGAFSHGDDVSVKENYFLLFDTLGWDGNHLAIARQVHGTRVMTVGEPGVYPDCDGLVTNITGLTIGIQVADCAAIVLFEPEARIAAALHAGWRGAVSGIVFDGLNSMMNLGGDASKVLAYISPCISLQNFEVGAEVAKLFPDEFCDYTSFDKPHVDLSGFVASQLKSKGVLEKNIESSNHCTFAEDQFYSYRRERESAGRMLALIKII
jgi:YfiH family protein